MSIKIQVGKQADGYVFALPPDSQKIVRSHFDGTMPDQLFLSYEVRADYETLVGSIWKQVALLLTGLSITKLRDLDGVRFVDPVSNTVIHQLEGDENR